MPEPRSGVDPGVPADLLEALRAIQHQLGNAISAVVSHAAIVEQHAAAGTADRETAGGLSLAGEQAMSVTSCLRHLLACYDPRISPRTDAAAVLRQVRDLICALATRQVTVDVEPVPSPPWHCEAPDCFLLICLVLFGYREQLREADHIRIASRWRPGGESAGRTGLDLDSVCITLTLSRSAAAPSERRGPAAEPALSEVLRRKLADFRAHVESERPGPAESILQITLPARQGTPP